MSDNKEQEFTIQPHPATTNNPADLQDDPSKQGGLRASNPNAAAMPGPHIPSADVAANLEKPKSREELKAEAAALNA